MYYDPRTPQSDTSFPELDDPNFWCAVAGPPPSSPPSRFYQQPPMYSLQPPPRPLIVEGTVVPPLLPPAVPPIPTRLPVVYQPLSPPSIQYVEPLPLQQPAIQAKNENVSQESLPLGKFLPLIGLGIVILLVGSIIGSMSTPSHSPGPANTSYVLYGNPSVSADFINEVLAHYNSPAAGTGQDLYALGLQYGVDPVFPLAFFMQESSFGQFGIANHTHSLGNIRCSAAASSCFHDPTNGDYAFYATWRSGYNAWYTLITGPVYKGAGLTTLEQIVPRYAPSEDKNNVEAYIANVKHAVDRWRSQLVEVANTLPTQTIVRLNQLDPAQYATLQEHDTWAYSACSAAAITEYINALNKARGITKQYRITDILAQEIAMHAITPESGLLEPAGIDRTVARFGVKTTWLKAHSIASLVFTANKGFPIIVGFPPETIQGGHILIVKGGDTKHVLLVDSSSRNWQSLDYASFARFWRGFAVLLNVQ